MIARGKEESETKEEEQEGALLGSNVGGCPWLPMLALGFQVSASRRSGARCMARYYQIGGRWRRIGRLVRCDRIGCVAARSSMLMLTRSKPRSAVHCSRGRVDLSVGMPGTKQRIAPLRPSNKNGTLSGPMDSFVWPVITYRLSWWPLSAVVGGTLDRCQRKMVIVIQVCLRYPGEGEGVYYRRRARTLGAMCRTAMLWRMLATQQAVCYKERVSSSRTRGLGRHSHPHGITLRTSARSSACV